VKAEPASWMMCAGQRTKPAGWDSLCGHSSGWIVAQPRRRWLGSRRGRNQLEFVNLIVDHLTEHGIMDPARLYESPFTDITPRGPDGLFKASELDQLVSVMDAVRAAAVA
jgi:type I site-specific restriction endonuclease